MSEHIFKLPDLGEGTVESEIGEWFIKVGDEVAEEHVVATMMTDKAAVEISSPVSGKVISLAGQPGDMVAVGAPLVVFATNGNSVDSEVEIAQSKPAAQSRQGVEQKSANSPNTKVATSPAIRRQAKEAGIDLATIKGSGTGGRILRSDMEALIQDRSVKPATSLPGTKTIEKKIIGLRRIIADRMSAANREIPHFSYVEETDITELEALRKHLNEKNDSPQSRLTLLPFIALALVRALHEFPQCNATHDQARNLLLQHAHVNLGIATQTSDGLKVPVVRNAEQKSVLELAAEIRRVSDSARSNSARKDELSGSTITITSLGKLGGIATTPVINMPEVAIVGINRAVSRPVVVDDQIAIRLMMNISSSFDHRFVDGYDAAAMIQRVKELLEHPATIFV